VHGGVHVSVSYRPADDLKETERDQLISLLSSCFVGPGNEVFQTQIFWREAPQHRMLCFDASARICAQLAGHDKSLSVGERQLRVLGIAELAVLETCRGQGLARLLLERMEAWAQAQGFGFCVLSGKTEIYSRLGYQGARNIFLYQDWPSLTPRRNALPNIQYKALGSRAWPTGEIDLKGPLW
jgi:predicted acetyltransferase